MLWVDGVVAGYHEGIDVHRGVTLRVEARRVTAVIGPNGAGKSTLLRVVFGLLAPRRGRVVFDGHDIQELPPDTRKRRGIGYVPQGTSTFPQMTVEETLRVGGWTIRHDRARLRDRIAHVYDLFPVLAQLRRVRAGVLSGGQLRMLAIAKELVVMPSLLLVDEPTAGLAPRIADDVYRLLERARELGIAVMLVDQNIAEAVALADHVCVMALGRVQRAGPRESVAADLRILVQEALIGTGG